ncbi:MAG: tRNA pseudouridine(55) synthase TruB, partial [Vicinamibacteria bacterium]|nr:tRNA pseudouridine(55) synthase TruB [Vicinamibacteria bacterium]
MTERGAAPVSSGVLVIDKPAGITSHDVVALIRRALHVRRIGHTGTLDPFATGVLPLCVGQATRLAQFLSADIKVYDAVVRLGWATETDDLKGAPITAVNSDLPSEAAVRSICREFVGRQAQVPPLYSAKWIDGRRAHERARQGQRVELAPAMVVIEELIVHGYRDGEISMSVACSAGTYIRALARDIGTRLGVGGHLRALRRTRSGEFTLEQAMPLDVGRG